MGKTSLFSKVPWPLRLLLGVGLLYLGWRIAVFYGGDSLLSELTAAWGGGGSSSLESAPATLPQAEAPVAAAATAAVAADKQLPEPGSEVSFEQVADLIGQHVDIDTKLGTHRSGIVHSHLPQVMALELDNADGTFILTLYSSDVTRIQYTPVVAEAQ